MSANQDIQKYKESLKLAWGYNDYNDWPIKFNSIMHLFVTEFTREYLEDFSQLLYQGCRIAERTQIQVPGLNGRVEEPVKSQKTT